MTFDLFTVRSILLPYAFVWEKCSEFQTTSSLEPLGQFCSNFILNLGWGNERLLKWSRLFDQDGRHAHIWYKPLKIFFFITEDALGLNLCISHREREVYWHLTKNCSDWKSKMAVILFMFIKFPATVLFTCIKSWFFRNHLANFHQISHWSYCWNVIDSLFKWLCSIDCQAHIFFFKTKNCSNDDLFIGCYDRIGKNVA